MTSTLDTLMRQFLGWVGETPRSYGEAMEAWKTSCPRMTVWEDALREGLVTLESNETMRGQRVVLTPRGRRLLEQVDGA